MAGRGPGERPDVVLVQADAGNAGGQQHLHLLHLLVFLLRLDVLGLPRVVLREDEACLESTPQPLNFADAVPLAMDLCYVALQSGKAGKRQSTAAQNPARHTEHYSIAGQHRGLETFEAAHGRDRRCLKPRL